MQCFGLKNSWGILTNTRRTARLFRSLNYLDQKMQLHRNIAVLQYSRCDAIWNPWLKTVKMKGANLDKYSRTFHKMTAFLLAAQSDYLCCCYLNFRVSTQIAEWHGIRLCIIISANLSQPITDNWWTKVSIIIHVKSNNFKRLICIKHCNSQHIALCFVNPGAIQSWKAQLRRLILLTHSPPCPHVCSRLRSHLHAPAIRLKSTAHRVGH